MAKPGTKVTTNYRLSWSKYTTPSHPRLFLFCDERYEPNHISPDFVLALRDQRKVLTNYRKIDQANNYTVLRIVQCRMACTGTSVSAAYGSTSFPGTAYNPKLFNAKSTAD